jgi:guanine deaminase
MTQNKFMERAIALALENVQSGRGGPFGAIVMKDGKILAEGTNCVTLANDPTAHAEIVAIREACKKLGNSQLAHCEVYSSCEPCPMCLGAIYWARPERIYFASTAGDAAKAGFDDSLIYQEMVKPHRHRKIPMIQIMREEALAAFHAWKVKPDKISY